MKNILQEALEDTKLLKEIAIENAKNVLVEAVVPKIKQVVEHQLGETDVALECGDMAGQDQLPDMEETPFPGQMAAGVPGMMPGLAGAVPGIGLEVGMYEDEPQLAPPPPPVDLDLDAEPAEEPAPKKADSEGGEKKEKKKEKKEESTMDQEAVQLEADKKDDEKEVDEVVQITQEDLRAAFSEVLKQELSEATVSKSFGDVSTPEEGGILDKKSGETHFKDAEAPAAQDWTVKEAAYKKLLKKLSEENEQYKKACAVLKKNLHEVHLFNSKLLYTNKLIGSVSLSNKQKLAIIEAFDKATNVREVELVYNSLSESLKIAGALTESRSPSKVAKASRYAAPSSTVLREAVDREETRETQTAHWQRLAGLID
jgi:hypothetical protein